MKKNWNQPTVEELDVRASMAGGDNKTSPDGTVEYIKDGELIVDVSYNKTI